MESILIPLIVTIGFLGEITFGFGGGLVVIPMLSLILGVKDAVTITLAFQILMGVALIGSFKHIYWKKSALILPLMLAGGIVGAYFLAFIDDSVLRILLATLIIIFLTKNVLPKIPHITSWKNNFGAGIFSAVAGWMQGTMGISGPLIAMYFSEMQLSKEQIRATLIFYLFIINIVRFPATYDAGLFTETNMSFIIQSLPFFLLAVLAGSFIQRKIPEVIYKNILNVILGTAAVSLLLQTF